MHIIFDWDGTIAKPEIAKEAGMMRNKMLGLNQSEEKLKEHMKTDSHFNILTNYISEQTGIVDKKYLTTMMTDLFRYSYHVIVNQKGEKILYDGMKEVIQQLSKNHDLSIASTLRQDLLDYSLKRIGLRNNFKGVYGNTPALDYSKKHVITQAINNHGIGNWMIGDKLEDMIAGRSMRTKTAFVVWGAGELTDFIPEIIAKTPEDLLEMVE